MNIRKLMAEMAYNECTVAKLADLLGLSKTSVYRKLSGKTEFTRSEIAAMRSSLKLGEESFMSIFFAS